MLLFLLLGIFIGWCCKCLFNRPIVIESPKNGVSEHSSSFGPARDTHGFSIEINNVKPALVPSLSFWLCPNAILWAIITIVVDTLNCMYFAWRESHILKEILKTTQPAFTDLYSSATVILVKVIIGIRASVFHSLPTSIQFCITHAMTSYSAHRLSPYKKETPSGLAVFCSGTLGHWGSWKQKNCHTELVPEQLYFTKFLASVKSRIVMSGGNVL